jgi:polyisoprenoid-binding protein YceI
MRILVAALALSAAVATPIVAQQMQMPGSKSVAAITGGTYAVDPNHSFVIWEVNHFGFSPLSGMFGEITGTLQLDPKNVAATKVDVTIPISKLAVASEGFRGHLLRPGKDGGKPDFFGASPADAKFVSTSVVATDDDEAKMTGNLTINGITKPVTLEVDFYGAGTMPAAMGGKENVGFEAEGKIKRSDFGLGMAVPLVSDEVELKIAAAFQK